MLESQRIQNIITYNFGEDFIKKLSDYIYGNFSKTGNNFERVGCIFGGRRPSLFLRKELSSKIKGPFIPPRCFSIDEFIDYIVEGQGLNTSPSELDLQFLIYKLAKKRFQAKPSFIGNLFTALDGNADGRLCHPYLPGKIRGCHTQFPHSPIAQ